jgi:RimJ/RimL family protein N-acetyltransferase
VIETSRCRLRRIGPEDHDAYYSAIFADDAVMRFLPWGKAISREKFERKVLPSIDRQWDRHGFGLWLVELTETGEIAGHCGMQYWPGTEDVEVFYGLGRAFWGRGLATEAAQACVDFGFRELGLGRIIAGIVPGNEASRRVLEKLGMREFGTLEVDGVRCTGFDLLQSSGDQAPNT